MKRALLPNRFDKRFRSLLHKLDKQKVNNQETFVKNGPDLPIVTNDNQRKPPVRL